MNMQNDINYVEIGLQVAELGLHLIELVEYIRRRRFRRWWSKPHIRQNYLTGYGGYARVFQYFHFNDEEDFIKFTRLTVQVFEYVYSLVRERLIKRSRRPPLPPELRFTLTINYLAHADSLQKNEKFYNIGLSTVKQIIPEVCNVLCEVLMPLFLYFPTREQFKVIANEFMEDLDFPHCVGALDGRHCRIRKPPHSGSLFFNYKKFYSIVLMACCDSKKRFIWANIGDYGSFNDAGIFANSDLGRSLAQNEIQLPPPAPLPDSQVVTPFVFIGDGCFPLKQYLMKPFMRNDHLTVPHKVFNYRLSHARQIVESSFGQLSQKWLPNEKALEWKLSTIERIIMSTICLHNVVIDFEHNEVGNRWSNHGIVEQVVHENQRNVIEVFRIRERLADYFISPAGSVPWQWARI